MKGELTGGGQCGAGRYTISGARVAYCCHCTECQKQSASAFGISVPVFENQFNVDGPLECWTRSTDSGSMTDCYFCKRCGSRVYHAGRSRPGFLTVKGGSLDDPDELPLVAHIWTASRRRDVLLDPDLPHWETQPRDNAEWINLFQKDTTL